MSNNFRPETLSSSKIGTSKEVYLTDYLSKCFAIGLEIT